MAELAKAGRFSLATASSARTRPSVWGSGTSSAGRRWKRARMRSRASSTLNMAVFPPGVGGRSGFDTPPGLAPHGCSLQHGRLAHRSTTGLPGPQAVSRCLLISVGKEPTGGTDMGANGETLLDPFATH